MAPNVLYQRTKWYFNTPEMLARLGKWRNDTLARVGAYAKGVFRNKLGRPQLKQTKERTVQVVAKLQTKSGRSWNYSDTLFVPRSGVVVSRTTGKPAPTDAARIALRIVSARLKGQGAGKPPRMGPSKQMRIHNEFALDPTTESVVVGTKPLPHKTGIAAASVPQLLNEGLAGFINNKLLPGGTVFTTYAEHPYVESVMEPAQRKLTEIIRRHPAG